MSYLTQTRPKKKGIKSILYVFLGLVLVSLLSFTIFNSFFLNTSSSAKNFLEKISTLSYFMSKKSLTEENASLKEEINKLKAENINKEALVSENLILSEKLNIVDNKSYVVANVLERPGFSPYDFLVIDEGLSKGLSIGLNVFYGNYAIGNVVEVAKKTAKVEVFSSPGKTFNVLLGSKKVPANATGRGGGSFEILLPQGIESKEGDLIVLADDPLKVFGVVSSVVVDPQDDFTHIYFTLPTNVFELSSVMVAL